MKILQIIPSVSMVYGGPSQMVLGLSKALAEQGVTLTILTTDANGDSGQAPLEVPLDRPVIQDGYEIRYFRCSPFRRYKFSTSLLQWLSSHSYEYDLAHIHALFSPVSSFSAAIARHHHLPYILRPLGTLDPADLQKKRSLKQLYAAFLERPNLAGASALHFTSDQEAKISERFGTLTRDIVLPLGVNPVTANPSARQAIREQYGIPGDRPLLLFMSRLDPKKGLDLLIPALEQLLTEGLDFHFVLAGSNAQDPDYEQQIRDRIQSSALGEKTAIAGFVSGHDKADLLQAADLFVLPSYYENFGIAVAEAMVAGVPVVISDQVYIWEQIQQATAGWVSPCSVDGLVEQLRSGLMDSAERQRRGENAKAYALEHYSWGAIAQQMMQIYQQILTPHLR
ncbi:MAG: hormogonium polysaccharide biosynthesis glycosyltransferase HpsP [Oculatellaceae cyanobacterium Prado106]|jgi:glycosyltransferase involved in cell wall biosynthesis|nr:hormogonium polysaccharide biosynthesis glycosyltransferase HpsP [Oculatellaceae cyanobacterium Prado106]